MTEYLVKMQGFVDKRETTDHLVPHEEQIEHILNGLSPKYESFVTSTSTKPGGIGELDIGVISSLLFIQENHLDITNGGQETLLQISTHIAVQNSNKKKKYQGTFYQHNNPSMNNDKRNNSGGKNSQHFQNKNLQNNNFFWQGSWIWTR